jgi:hypothetical protein
VRDTIFDNIVVDYNLHLCNLSYATSAPQDGFQGIPNLVNVTVRRLCLDIDMPIRVAAHQYILQPDNLPN